MADRIEVDQLSRWTGRPQTRANTITPKRRVLCTMLDRSRCGSTNDGQHVQDSGYSIGRTQSPLRLGGCPVIGR
jgi:hypothetical protein